MLQHLRLARARGSLVAPNSRVQDRALDYLLMLEQREKQEARLDALKHSILQFPGPVPRDRIQSLFPEFFPADLVFEDAKQEDGTYDIDKIPDAEVAWATPGDTSVDDEISAWIAQQEHGSVTAAEIDTEWR